MDSASTLYEHETLDLQVREFGITGSIRLAPQLHGGAKPQNFFV
jgi:hypothetical protein